MGKAIIIVLLGVIVIYGVSNLVINQNIQEMSEDSIDNYAQTIARNLGNSAVEILKVRVAEDVEYRVTSAQSMTIGEGSVTYRVVDTTYVDEPLIKLDVRANYLDASKKIDAFLKILNSVPPHFSRSVLGEDEVTFNGDQLAVKDTNNPNLNADVHSNYLVKLNGSNYLFEGFITSAGDITIGGINMYVLPNYNPLNLPAMQKYVTKVAIPNFVASNYLSKATTVYSGDKTLSGNIILGTRTNPKIIYIKGKAIFNATNITGYGVIVVEQDVEVYGNVKITSPHPQLSQFGLFTSGKVNVNNPNLTLEATLFCQNEISINTENVNIIGSITSKNKITFNGLNEKLYYKPPAYEITSIFFDVKYLRPTIVYWYE